MTEDRAQVLEDFIIAHRYSELAGAMREWLIMRRETYRDKLEGANNEEVRGRAKECKDILNILVDN